MAQKPPSNRVSADPAKWSVQSQGSVAAGWTTEYKDIRYKCWRCQANAVFTAADQKYTYEDKKAPIDQQRVLCESCWRESLHVDTLLLEYQGRWAASKQSLRADKPFLAGWLALLESKEGYGSYRHDVARKNMLRKLLGAA
jgi:hypothetical protein